MLSKKNKKLNPQKKGKKGENNSIKALKVLFEQFSRISSIRKYESGFQGGKDIKTFAFFKKNNFLGIVGDKNLKWFFEVKHYESKLNPEKVVYKIHQVKASNLEIDCFCLFSPKEDIHGILEDSLSEKKVLDNPEYPFKIVLWTPSQNIKSKLSCFPEVYKEIYDEESNISDDDKKEILNNWIEEIYKQTEEGKKIREDFVTKFKGINPIWIPESINYAQNIIIDDEGQKTFSEKQSILEQKLRMGGINEYQDILKAKRNRILSEGIRRKYKKSDEIIFMELTSIKYELENFCLDLEKNILEKESTNEAR